MKIVVENLINKLYKSEILKFDPNIEIIVLNPEDHTNPAWEDVPEIDALFLSYQFLFAVRDHKHLFKPMLEVAKKAKFIQSGYSGMDDPFLQAVLKETDAVVANSSSIHGKPMANYVLAQMLRWNKRIDLHIELQKEKNWLPNGGDGELTNKNLLIYGYGGIGKEIARIAKSFEMNVTGIRRSPETCEFADEVKAPEDLMDMLPFADFLVTVLPDNENTRDVINKKVLKQMNPQSMLINVGRGSAVNEIDLADALNSGEIASAALDTTKKEPLEKDSPLWEAKNCFISAHDSAHSLMSLPRSFNLFLENVANLKNKKPIKNLFEL
ncbi:D-2-hydroxyacid dehydrogenase [Gammaproteobacteria bacterium]|nr:D-2-hydroxyacid dehydrogenase [Gammaproteobacteria bacterium]|tara:strand:+ start:838 stop:1812 length:975 start_codon:yes stop_codon:yes gene_type:complete